MARTRGYNPLVTQSGNGRTGKRPRQGAERSAAPGLIGKVCHSTRWLRGLGAIWEDLATKLGRQFSYVEFETVRDLVQATAAANIDVAVTNLTINQARAERVDFTQPWFDGGDRIMVGTDRGSSFGSLIAGLSDAGFLEAYAWIASVIVVATVLLTLFDRRFDESFPKRWGDGIAESFYTVMSVATSGRPPSRKNLFGWIGRIWQGVWLVCGVAVVAYVTSSVTSVMTTLSLTNQITSLDDLSSQPVGVMAGTVQEDFAQSERLRARSYPGIDSAVEALVNGDVAAIIHDAPVLEYYAHTHSDQPGECGRAAVREGQVRLRPSTPKYLDPTADRCSARRARCRRDRQTADQVFWSASLRPLFMDSRPSCKNGIGPQECFVVLAVKTIPGGVPGPIYWAADAVPKW